MAVSHTFIQKDGFKTKRLTGVTAIREKCKECCGWNSAEVRRCPATDCVLHPFRFGSYGKKTATGCGFSGEKLKAIVRHGSSASKIKTGGRSDTPGRVF